MPGPSVAQLTALGFNKEASFASGGTPVLFPGYETWTPSPKNALIMRPDTRLRKGRSAAATGGYEFSANLRPAAQPDVLFPLLAYALGAQTTPTAAIYATTALTGSTAVGAGTVIPVTAGTGTNFISGDNVVLGAGTANVETVVISLPTANNFTATTTKTHAAADTAQGLCPATYTSVASFGSTLPSIAFDYTRNTSGGSAVQYVGCKFDTLKISSAPGQEAQFDFGIVGASEVVHGTPVTPTFSTLFPITNAASGGQLLYNGSSLPAGTILRKCDFSLNNNLEKTYLTVGSRSVVDFPLGQRAVSGSVELSFADDLRYQDFLGAVGANTPQSVITGLSLAMTLNSQSLADVTRGVRYGLIIKLPNCILTGNTVPGAQQQSLKQTLTFDAFETNSPGGDDMSLTFTANSATAY